MYHRATEVAMDTQEGTVRDDGILGIDKPEAKVEVVSAAQSRPEL